MKSQGIFNNNLPIYILKLLKNIEYYTDGSLANQTIDNNDLLHRADNNTVDLGRTPKNTYTTQIQTQNFNITLYA
ncbi:hypothetical protein RIR_jg20217.t1 [Rhizophagus irregularis DAOM 181602=DAOM 197198]|nr:hypothetical protein RIR_jg20217.t1 [Rhizophagus irregularis DAOM 181602=DAOM 197198]